MANPAPNVEKIRASSSHLLDQFLILLERYALLKPLLRDHEVQSRLGAGNRITGLTIIRNTLALNCAHDIAKLALDRDPRTPSLHIILKCFEDHELLTSELRDAYAEILTYVPGLGSGPELVASYNKLDREERDRRRSHFDECLLKAKEKWKILSAKPYMSGFATIRDKVTAHTEIGSAQESYRLQDIEDLGLRWDDMDEALGLIREIIELIGLVARRTSFAWEQTDTRLASASAAFWSKS